MLVLTLLDTVTIPDLVVPEVARKRLSGLMVNVDISARDYFQLMFHWECVLQWASHGVSLSTFVLIVTWNVGNWCIICFKLAQVSTCPQFTCSDGVFLLSPTAQLLHVSSFSFPSLTFSCIARIISMQIGHTHTHTHAHTQNSDYRLLL